MKRFALTLLGITLLSGSAMAADLPSVISGGVADAGREAIERVEDNYTLKLVFTGEGGMYLADVDVVIRDKAGAEVVRNTTEGPFLLANLEPGRYSVEARSEQYNKKLNVTVGSTLKTYHMRFPIKDGDAVSSAADLKREEMM